MIEPDSVPIQSIVTPLQSGTHTDKGVRSSSDGELASWPWEGWGHYPAQQQRMTDFDSF